MAYNHTCGFLKSTIKFQYAAKGLSAYFPFHHTKSYKDVCILKDQDLVQLIISIAPSRTFLSETGNLFIYCKCVVVKSTMSTNIVWYHCFDLCWGVLLTSAFAPSVQIPTQ